MVSRDDDPYYFPPEAFVEKEEESSKVALVKEYSLDPFDEYYAETYLRVGLFCGWNWNEFMETPQWVVDYIDGEIVRRFSTNDPKNNKPEPLNYFHSALILALGRLFGGDPKKPKKKR
mgnify:CR=1 FL=1